MMILNISKKKIAVLLLGVFIWITPVNLFAFSLGAGGMIPGLPFGGIVSFTIPCTCSKNLWIWFTPLHISGKTIAGPLIYQPGYTTLYGDFAIGIPGTWHLGSYIPVVGNGVCWQYVGTACVVMPNYGLINKLGTGLP